MAFAGYQWVTIHAKQLRKPSAVTAASDLIILVETKSEIESNNQNNPYSLRIMTFNTCVFSIHAAPNL